MTAAQVEEDSLIRDDGGAVRESEAPVVGYLVSRFPHFSETFIVREMSAVEEAGIRVVPFALLRQEQEPNNDDSRRWLPRVHWTGLSDGLIGANVRAWWRQPRACAAVWRRALRSNACSPAFLVRTFVVVPKAVLVAEVLRRQGASHLHAHYATHPALAAWVVHRLTGLPYSVTVHAHDVFTTSPMLETKLGAAAFVATVSEFNRTWIAAHVGHQVARRTEVVRCGVVADRYAQPRVPRRSGEPFRLLCTGSLQEYKGHRYLVEACALLRSRGLDLRCSIVGEGRLRPQLEALVRARDLEGVVTLLGVCDEQEVAALLARSDCYVQPSVVAVDGQMEGVPVALMEAMAAGVPAVATLLSGVPELVVEGSTGRLVPPGDARALADAVFAVAGDGEAAQRLADAGRRHVLENYDVRKNARALAALLAPSRSHPTEELSA